MTHTQELEGLKPSLAYARGVEAGWWQADTAQQACLPMLDGIFNSLHQTQSSRSVLEIFLKPFRPAKVERGLYLWGGVGRGKTFLMDLLYDSLPNVARFRQHFHRFMGRIHDALKARAGMQNPLDDIAHEWAKKTRLICLDEFFVQDIGDAMILANLLEALFERGVVLVTTSNTAPQNLYKDGLQRARFLPAIAMLQKNCQVHELMSRTDYRLRALTQASVYLTPNNARSENALADCFERLVPVSEHTEREMLMFGRVLQFKRRADGVIWFEFAELCEGPRAVADYIEIAKSYNTVLISNLPSFSTANEDAAKRFIHLIDEFYDRQVNLIVSAAHPPTLLYQGHRHRAEFERTASRLIEMQSREYIAREHLA